MRGSSLRQQLLIWLLPASVAIMIASILIAFLIATRAAGQTWDQSLHDAAEAFAERIRTHPDQVPTALPAVAERLLIADLEDRVWFRLARKGGQPVAGSTELPVLPRGRGDEAIRYGDGHYQGHAIRLVALNFEFAHGEMELTLGSTMRKRDALVRDILLGMIIPELSLFFAMIILMEIAIERGLAPLKKLRADLAARSHLDLRPVGDKAVPDELKAVVAAINELLARLEGSMTAQSAFVSDAAHQLRTPIAALQTQAEILLREMPGSPHEERLTYLVTATTRLSHLVRQLLALARAEPLSQTLETFDLSSLVEEAAESLLPLAFASRIDLGFELEAARTRGSPILVREMIANLVDNGVRYTSPPGSVTVRCRPSGSDVLLQVEDSGPGIPPGERVRIFERFHRLPDSGAGGSGLGLAIVREIAQKHGGTVTVDDGPLLGGALFEVRLPRA